MSALPAAGVGLSRSLCPMVLLRSAAPRSELGARTRRNRVGRPLRYSTTAVRSSPLSANSASRAWSPRTIRASTGQRSRLGEDQESELLAPRLRARGHDAEARASENPSSYLRRAASASASLRLCGDHGHLAVLVDRNDVSLGLDSPKPTQERFALDSLHDNCVGIGMRLDLEALLELCLQECVQSVLPSARWIDRSSQFALSSNEETLTTWRSDAQMEATARKSTKVGCEYGLAQLAHLELALLAVTKSPLEAEVAIYLRERLAARPTASLG